MFEDYSERLFAHFVAGRWRVPYAAGRFSLTHPDGRALGQVVPAGPEDVARAAASLRGSDGIARAQAAEVIAREADSLIAAHAHQSGELIPGVALRGMTLAMAEAPADGPHLLIGPPFATLKEGVDSGAFGRGLGAGLHKGVIWCPPPEWAFFATRLAEILQHVDLPPGAFCLLHTQLPQTEAALRRGVPAQK